MPKSSATRAYGFVFGALSSVITLWMTLPLSAQDLEVAEQTLARLIARAYAADHPELFDPPGETASASSDRKTGIEESAKKSYILRPS